MNDIGSQRDGGHAETREQLLDSPLVSCKWQMFYHLKPHPSLKFRVPWSQKGLPRGTPRLWGKRGGPRRGAPREEREVWGYALGGVGALEGVALDAQGEELSTQPTRDIVVEV